MTTATRAQPPVGFLVKTFPKLSETFIFGEVLGLERLGVNLHLFALVPPAEAQRHGAASNVKAPIRYLPQWRWLPPLALWRDHWALFRQAPGRYRKALGFARRRSEAGGLRDWINAGWLARRLQEAGINHLHSHFISQPTGIAELVQQLSGIGYSISAHAKDIYLSPPDVLHRKLAAARFCVTCTGYNRNHLDRIAAGTTTVHRQYHGINLERFQRRRDAVETPAERPPLLLSIGRYREKKGFTTLIDACHRLRERSREFRCQIIGYGPDHLKLQQQIDELGLSRHVQLVEPMTHEQIIERYCKASLFVLPSLIASDGDRDGIPNVLLEAMAMELPVISTRVSGIPEVIEHGATGLLVDPAKLKGRPDHQGTHQAGASGIRHTPDFSPGNF